VFIVLAARAKADMKIRKFCRLSGAYLGAAIAAASPSLSACYPGLPCPDEALREPDAPPSTVVTPDTTASINPSFDCSTIRVAAEVAICQNPELAMLDNQLSALYIVAKNRLNSRKFKIVRDQQRNWLKQRDECGIHAACIKSLYISRINALSSL